jgi:DNA repair exonuclease SbcCD ATPase subunit
MRVTFKKLNMEHFKNHEAFAVEFGAKTAISGRNGAGKSSTGESVTWLLFGVDMMGGSKFDPTPLTATKEDITKVELLLEVEREGQDPFELLLGKQLVKGKAKYFVNEVPEKAGRFDEVVSELFDKNLFLSMFNPVYFPSQKWQEQREQLLKYVEEPFKAEILEQISKAAKEALEEKLKKHSLEDLVKIYGPKHKDNKTKLERAGERVVTLKEQLNIASQVIEDMDEEQVKQRIAEHEQQLAEIRSINSKAQDEGNRKAEMEFNLKAMKQKIQGIAAKAQEKQAEPLQDHCRTCEQPLKAEALEAVKKNQAEQVAAMMAEGKALADEYRKLFAEWQELPDPSSKVDSGTIQEQLYNLKSRLEAKERVAALEAQVEQAEKDKQQIRADYLEAQAVIDAAKEYETAKAELMVKKVSGLFDRLTVKLFEEFQNGNSKPTFEIEYQGKPYAKLSTAERIKAGLEIVEALAGQAQINLPVFVDNAESIITFKQPSGQLITATVKNSHLVVKKEEQQ